MAVTLLVVQHGEKVRAAGDPGLTDVGQGQATLTAQWLLMRSVDVEVVWSSPLARSVETAQLIAAALGAIIRIDERLRERMNWEDETAMGLEEFLAEWTRASFDRHYEPSIGDSSVDAAERFTAALVDIAEEVGEGFAVVVAHGGVTVDTLRSTAGDKTVNLTDPQLIPDGVPCCAITTFAVDAGKLEVVAFPAIQHLGSTTQHRPA